MQLSRAFIALSIGLCAATMVAAQTAQPDSLTDPKLPSSSGDDKKLDLPNDDVSTKKSKKTKSADTTSLPDDKTTDAGTSDTSDSPDLADTVKSGDQNAEKTKSKKGKDESSKVEVTEPGKGIGAGADPSTASGEDSGKAHSRLATLLQMLPFQGMMLRTASLLQTGLWDATRSLASTGRRTTTRSWTARPTRRLPCCALPVPVRPRAKRSELAAPLLHACFFARTTDGADRSTALFVRFIDFALVRIFLDYTKVLVQKMNLSNGTDTTAALDTGAAIDKGTKSGATDPSINYGSKDSKDGPTDQPIDPLASTPDSTTDAGTPDDTTTPTTDDLPTSKSSDTKDDTKDDTKSSSSKSDGKKKEKKEKKKSDKSAQGSLTSTDVKPTDTETVAGTAGSETTTSPQKRSGFVRRSLAKKLRH